MMSSILFLCTRSKIGWAVTLSIPPHDLHTTILRDVTKPRGLDFACVIIHPLLKIVLVVSMVRSGQVIRVISLVLQKRRISIFLLHIACLDASVICRSAGVSVGEVS